VVSHAGAQPALTAFRTSRRLEADRRTSHLSKYELWAAREAALLVEAAENFGGRAILNLGSSYSRRIGKPPA